MLKKYCKHKWVPTKRGGRHNGTIYPVLFKCKKCELEMHSSEVFQLETVNHLTGFQKWSSIIAVALSFAAFTISLLTYLYK